MQRNASKPETDTGNQVVGPVCAPPVLSGARPVVEFLRLPPPGQRCPHTGLSRSYLNDLILPTVENGNRPPVRSFVLRKRGAQTGVRIIDAASLFNYIRRHEDTGTQPASQERSEPA